MHGETIKTITLNGTGNGVLTLEKPSLSDGTSVYSLYIDDKLIDTKKMVMASPQRLQQAFRDTAIFSQRQIE
jgi:hypothetical protein